MGNMTAQQYDDALFTMTKLQREKREQYIKWQSTITEVAFIEIKLKQTKRYYILRSKYNNMYSLPVIYLAAYIETLMLFCESANDIVDFSCYWFNEIDYKYAKKALVRLKNE